MTISSPQYDLFSGTFGTDSIESDIGDAERIIDSEFFSTSLVQLKVNINGTFIIGSMKRWNGTQWVNCLNAWDGTQWTSVI